MHPSFTHLSYTASRRGAREDEPWLRVDARQRGGATHGDAHGAAAHGIQHLEGERAVVRGHLLGGEVHLGSSWGGGGESLLGLSKNRW